MSQVVASDELEQTLAGYGIAYLITIGADIRPHAVEVHAELDSHRFLVADTGNSTRRNIGERDTVTLLWPPLEPGGYTLLVDGTATLTDRGIEIVVTRAVQHRAATEVSQSVGACGSDCHPLAIAAQPGS
ncbi:pyridoxamine 5'-phosphate oxidase family protein [Nocardia sp. NPDC020380]|uniref:pyridoxamine 5'-phosphate oxidase family protein n=1 Tax=Nocardia sp. NPDC020380 TaxID=3364309 RepID=UPI00379824F2